MSVGTLNEKMEIYLQKYINMVEALTELNGNVVCESCSKKLRNILRKHSIHKGSSHLGGGRSSFAAMNDKSKECLSNEYSTREYK
jgi:hypothetical protein